jgi:hypothetical protein
MSNKTYVKGFAKKASANGYDPRRLYKFAALTPEEKTKLIGSIGGMIGGGALGGMFGGWKGLVGGGLAGLAGGYGLGTLKDMYDQNRMNEAARTRLMSSPTDVSNYRAPNENQKPDVNTVVNYDDILRGREKRPVVNEMKNGIVAPVKTNPLKTTQSPLDLQKSIANTARANMADLARRTMPDVSDADRELIERKLNSGESVYDVLGTEGFLNYANRHRNTSGRSLTDDDIPVDVTFEGETA